MKTLKQFSHNNNPRSTLRDIINNPLPIYYCKGNTKVNFYIKYFSHRNGKIYSSTDRAYLSLFKFLKSHNNYFRSCNLANVCSYGIKISDICIKKRTIKEMSK